MSADCITFDKSRNFFAFDGQYGYDGTVVVRDGTAVVQEPETGRYNKLTPNVLGKIIAKSLVKGATMVEFETCCVSVNYLVEMLRFSGKYGWFHDVLSTTMDHAFDPNTPTPGFYCGKVRELREEAKLQRQYARLARCAHRYDEADDAEQTARDIDSQVRELRTGI